MNFISKYKAYFISLGIAIALCLTAFFVIHWEIERAKARAFDKAKVITKEAGKSRQSFKDSGQGNFRY
jgi:parvulin-like peptidyl-prolyl isomerase